MAQTPKDPLDHEPGAVIRAREKASLTKTDVARRLGVSLSLISMIESGGRNAGPDMIRRLADVFGCPPDHLKRKDGKPSPRLAVVCAECSGLWEPDHQCPSRRAALGPEMRRPPV